MPHFRWLPLFGALIAVIGASSGAIAGPLVTWSFRAVAQPPEEPRVLFAELIRTEGTYSTPSGYTETVGLYTWTTESGHPRPDESGMVALSESFGVGITLIDNQSGQSVELPFWLTAWTHWDQGLDGEWDLIAAGESWEPYPSYEQSEFMLGRNQYRVWHEPSALLVSVNAGPNVPEPATLALAGLGLAGVGLTSLRRFSRR